MNVDSIYGFRLPKQQLFIVQGIPKITAFATHPGSNETRCSKPGFFHLAIKAASWAMVGTVGTVTWKQNQSCLKPPPRSIPFNTLPHASVQLKSCIFLLEEPIVELSADRLGDGRCSKMFEDVRAVFPGISLRKKKSSSFATWKSTVIGKMNCCILLPCFGPAFFL